MLYPNPIFKPCLRTPFQIANSTVQYNNSIIQYNYKIRTPNNPPRHLQPIFLQIHMFASAILVTPVLYDTRRLQAKENHQTNP